jgi:hypothetical protein
MRDACAAQCTRGEVAGDAHAREEQLPTGSAAQAASRAWRGIARPLAGCPNGSADGQRVLSIWHRPSRTFSLGRRGGLEIDDHPAPALF